MRLDELNNLHQQDFWPSFTFIRQSKVSPLGRQVTNLEKRKKGISMRLSIKFCRHGKARFFRSLAKNSVLWNTDVGFEVKTPRCNGCWAENNWFGLCLWLFKCCRVPIKADIHAGLNLHKQFTFSSSQSQTGRFKCFDSNDLKRSFLAANQWTEYSFWQYFYK